MVSIALNAATAPGADGLDLGFRRNEGDISDFAFNARDTFDPLQQTTRINDQFSSVVTPVVRPALEL